MTLRHAFNRSRILRLFDPGHSLESSGRRVRSSWQRRWNSHLDDTCSLCSVVAWRLRRQRIKIERWSQRCECIQNLDTPRASSMFAFTLEAISRSFFFLFFAWEMLEGLCVIFDVVLQHGPVVTRQKLKDTKIGFYSFFYCSAFSSPDVGKLGVNYCKCFSRCAKG